MRNHIQPLPPSPEDRRALLVDLFQANPQMQRAVLEVRERELEQLTDRDVEICLLQMQKLEAFEPEGPESFEQQPETD
jgi:hypothetical protein